MFFCRRSTGVVVPNQLHHVRTFIAARVKWVRDPYLDTVVSKEKNLKQVIALMNQILSSPSKSLPLSSLSLLKSSIDLHTRATPFLQNYHTLFTLFQPSPSLPVHVKLTHQAISLRREEEAIRRDLTVREDSAKRLAKLLMLTGSCRLPLHLIERFRFDLGLPCDYVTALLSDYPEYFNVCEGYDGLVNKDELFLELVCWRREFAVSEVERRAGYEVVKGVKRGGRLEFALSYPNGFDLKKRVKDWVFEWQGLPYVSPYENAFHLSPMGDQAEKWTVAVLHELLWLLVSKKTEKENLLLLGNYLGFEDRFRKVVIHHPGIFYVSNKIRTQTVVLREAYRKDMLVEKHPLMGMRYRYIHLMNKSDERWRRSSSAGVVQPWLNKSATSSSTKKVKEKIDHGSLKTQLLF